MSINNYNVFKKLYKLKNNKLNFSKTYYIAL